MKENPHVYLGKEQLCLAYSDPRKGKALLAKSVSYFKTLDPQKKTTASYVKPDWFKMESVWVSEDITKEVSLFSKGVVIFNEEKYLEM